MATFKGTFDEFYQWADARTRLWITQETRSKRNGIQQKVGCSACQRKDVRLTAAHVTPRKQVVREALGVVENHQVIEIDLGDAWTKIKAAHRPFEQKFRYLCEECHRVADGPPPEA